MQHASVDARDAYLTLTEATKHTPTRVSSNCIWRWCRRGVKARSGKQITLQHIRAGGHIHTTKVWLEEFFAAVAEADRAYFSQPAAPSPSPRESAQTTRQRKQSMDRAEAVLAAAGI